MLGRSTTGRRRNWRGWERSGPVQRKQQPLSTNSLTREGFGPCALADDLAVKEARNRDFCVKLLLLKVAPLCPINKLKKKNIK